MLVQISSSWSSFAFESRSRIGQQKRVSHTRNIEVRGRVWVRRGANHRLKITVNAGVLLGQENPY